MNFNNPSALILLILFVLTAVSFATYYFSQRRKVQLTLLDNRLSDLTHQKEVLGKEILFYEKRKEDLAQRSHQRRQLVHASRGLGACLDPADIQARLVETASSLFPSRPVSVSIGHNPDSIDRLVLAKGHPVMIPSSTLKGAPMIAIPIKAQGVVAGILRVGGIDGPLFSQDDFRMLDILGSMASLALENSVLFQRVQESALRDNLTGLWTHRAFQDHLEAALLEASRYNQPLSFILADVDHFKSVNDTHGHQAGDSVLQGFAHAFSRHARDVDVVARYGGEEFGLLLLQMPHDQALTVAETLRQDLERQRFSVGGKVLSVSASFGVATFPQDATSAQQLIRTADERLYRAKKAGRNQVIGRAA